MAAKRITTGQSICLYTPSPVSSFELTKPITQSKKAITIGTRSKITKIKLVMNKKKAKKTLDESLTTSNSLCHKGMSPASSNLEAILLLSPLLAISKTSPALKISLDNLNLNFNPLLHKPNSERSPPINLLKYWYFLPINRDFGTMIASIPPKFSTEVKSFSESISKPNCCCISATISGLILRINICPSYSF